MREKERTEGGEVSGARMSFEILRLVMHSGRKIDCADTACFRAAAITKAAHFMMCRRENSASIDMLM